MAGLFEDYNPIQRLGANQYGLGDTRKITKGSLISFYYPQSWAIIPNIIHDPYPMVILTDVWPKYVRGLNLHYLTFPYIRRVLGNQGGNMMFSYYHIRPDKYMANAFRMYVRQGIRRPRKLDLNWLLQVLKSVRSFAPGELEAMRKQIELQIQQRLQAKADELTSYDEMREAYKNWYGTLTPSQQRQMRGKAYEGQQILQGGVDRNLIYPNEGPIGLNPSQMPPQPGEGGPYSTDENL